jgi:KTSC domain
LNRTPLKGSSAILSAGYDESTRTLELEFSSLACYQFFNVPPSIYAAFLASGSKGQFHALYLQGKYEYKCIVPRPTKEQKHGDSDKAKDKQIRETKQAVAKRAKTRIS